MSYLISKYKGTYRLKAPYDQTNQFPRDLKGNYSDTDVYIDCLNNIQIFYYGRGALEAYIPSLGRGRNIVKNIYSDLVSDTCKYLTVTEKTTASGEKVVSNNYDYKALYSDTDLNKIIYDIVENDAEIIFKFKSENMSSLEKYFKPKTSAASRSPFSSKNLPKSDYKVPDNDLEAYDQIKSKLDREDVLKLGHMTNTYIKSMATKKNPYEKIKDDMKLKCLKGKEYIHCIGKWDSYIKFLSKEVDLYIKNKGE